MKEFIPLFSMAAKGNVGATGLIGRLAGMFSSIEDVDIAHDRLCGDQIWLLRHITCPVDFAIMVNRLNDLYSRRHVVVSANFWFDIQPLPKRSKATGLTAPFIVIILLPQRRIWPRHVYGGDENMISITVGGVGAEKQTVDCVILVWRTKAMQMLVLLQALNEVLTSLYPAAIGPTRMAIQGRE